MKPCLRFVLSAPPTPPPTCCWRRPAPSSVRDKVPQGVLGPLPALGFPSSVRDKVSQGVLGPLPAIGFPSSEGQDTPVILPPHLAERSWLLRIPTVRFWLRLPPRPQPLVQE